MSALGGRGTSRADELLFSVGGLGERGEFDEFEADMFDAATATTAADATIWGWAERMSPIRGDSEGRGARLFSFGWCVWKARRQEGA